MTDTSTTTSERKGDWIQTAVTHRKFWPLDPRPEDIDIRDIAHALSNICRFTGHTREFYSVAQHSVIASMIVPRPSALAALLHDSAEAYMGDIARPWKRFLYVRGQFDAQFETIRAAEHRLLDVILATFGCPVETDAAVWGPIQKADEILLVTEARDFMAPLASDWRHVPQNGYEILEEVIQPWSPIDARCVFLSRFAELTVFANG